MVRRRLLEKAAQTLLERKQAHHKHIARAPQSPSASATRAHTRSTSTEICTSVEQGKCTASGLKALRLRGGCGCGCSCGSGCGGEQAAVAADAEVALAMAEAIPAAAEAANGGGRRGSSGGEGGGRCGDSRGDLCAMEPDRLERLSRFRRGAPRVSSELHAVTPEHLQNYPH